MTLIKNILFIVFAIVASVVIFNVAEADDKTPIIVQCYSGGQTVLKGLTHNINFNGQMFSFQDLSGEKFEVPKAMCVINFGRDH